MGGRCSAEFSGGIPLPSSATVISTSSSSILERNADGSRLVHGLNCIEQQVEQHLVDLVGIVVDGRDRARYSISIMMRLVTACWRANITACSAVRIYRLPGIAAAWGGRSPAIR